MDGQDKTGTAPLLGYVVSTRVPDRDVDLVEYLSRVDRLVGEAILTPAQAKALEGPRRRTAGECYRSALMHYEDESDESREGVRYLVRLDKGTRQQSRTTRYLIREEVTGRAKGEAKDGTAHEELASVDFDAKRGVIQTALTAAGSLRQAETEAELQKIQDRYAHEQAILPSHCIRTAMGRLTTEHFPVAYGALHNSIFLPATAERTLTALKAIADFLNEARPRGRWIERAQVCVLRLFDCAATREDIGAAVDDEIEEGAASVRERLDRYLREQAAGEADTATLVDLLRTIKETASKAVHYRDLHTARATAAVEVLQGLQTEMRTLLGQETLANKPEVTSTRLDSLAEPARRVYEALKAGARDAVPFPRGNHGRGGGVEVVAWQAGYGTDARPMLTQENVQDKSTVTVTFSVALAPEALVVLRSRPGVVQETRLGVRWVTPAGADAPLVLTEWWNRTVGENTAAKAA